MAKLKGESSLYDIFKIFKYAFMLEALTAYFDFKIQTWKLRCLIFMSEDEYSMIMWYHAAYHGIIKELKVKFTEIRENPDGYYADDIFKLWEDTILLLKDVKYCLKEDLSSGLYAYEKEDK